MSANYLCDPELRDSHRTGSAMEPPKAPHWVTLPGDSKLSIIIAVVGRYTEDLVQYLRLYLIAYRLGI